MSKELAASVLDALIASVDRDRFSRALEGLRPAASASPSVDKTRTATQVLQKIVLSDILDDSILGARPGDTTYPLRSFLGTLSDHLDRDAAFTLANALNLFFRSDADEETRVHVAVEVSRLYYQWAEAHPLERDHLRELSPLLARLMSTQLDNVSFEAVDASKVFDSSLHERVPGSDLSRSAIRAPKSFLVRVVSNGRVRAKAWVRT